MANIRRMYLRAEMSDGDTVELLNFTVGSDGKVQKLDESSLDTLLDTPEVAKMWGNAFCVSLDYLTGRSDYTKPLEVVS